MRPFLTNTGPSHETTCGCLQVGVDRALPSPTAPGMNNTNVTTSDNAAIDRSSPRAPTSERPFIERKSADLVVDATGCAQASRSRSGLLRDWRNRGLAIRLCVGELCSEAFERVRVLAWDEPELVRVSLSDLRQLLQVLVGQQLRVGVTIVDRAEDSADRFGLALGTHDL